MSVQYKITFNIAWQREQTTDIVFIKDYEKQEFIILEDVSKDIWLGILNGLSVENICKQILSNYEVTDESMVKDDINEFIQDCINNKWIEAVDEQFD